MIKKILFFLFIPFLLYASDIKEEIKKYCDKGDFYYKKGDYDKAYQEYSKALELIKNYKEKLAQEKYYRETWQYKIGEDDILFLSVWQNPDLDTDLIIRPDGYVSIPLIGDIKTVGLTVPELTKIITEKLKDYIRNPQISITIKKIGGSKVILLGEINSPGVYNIKSGTRVMELIALGRDFTKDAVKNSVILVRGGFKNPTVRRLNLESVLKGDISDNIILEPEDIVYIPKTFISNLNYFLTQLLDPLTKGATIYKEIYSFDKY